MPDETLSGYADAGSIWVLSDLNGAPIRATLRLPEAGRVTGQGPCNSYSASQSAPYPWFKLGPIASTRRACPELQQEQAYFSALARMSLSEVSGDVLILSNEAGEKLVFRAAPAS